MLKIASAGLIIVFVILLSIIVFCILCKRSKDQKQVESTNPRKQVRDSSGEPSGYHFLFPLVAQKLGPEVEMTALVDYVSNFPERRDLQNLQKVFSTLWFMEIRTK